MGNWRTVNLRGSLDEADVDAARAFVTKAKDYSNWHCLIATDGLAGLGMWVGTEIHADGNLAERDYTVEDVAEALWKMVHAAPSLRLKVHCGDDYESEDCVATITVADGAVTIGEPERAKVSSVNEDVWKGRLFGVITGTSDGGVQ